MKTDTNKLIEVLEEELTYLRGECERWHTLYVEEAEERKLLQKEIERCKS